MPRTCAECRREAAPHARFCPHCGARLPSPEEPSAPSAQAPGELNLVILYTMAVLLVLAVLFPPWEAPPDAAPAFFGLAPFWSAPNPTAVVSRMLLIIETMTIAIGGLYASWVFRDRGRKD